MLGSGIILGQGNFATSSLRYVKAETSSLSPGIRASRRYIHMAGWSRRCCVMEI